MPEAVPDDEVRVGGRLRCETCGTEVVVVKAPASTPSCCAGPLRPFTAGDRR